MAQNRKTFNRGQRPFHLLLFTSLLLLIISFLPDQKQTIDIHVHDTYFVIAQSHVFWLLAFWLWVSWALYHFTARVLYSNTLTWIHVGITLLTVSFLLWLLYAGDHGLQPRRYLDASTWHSLDRLEHTSKRLAYSLLTLLLGQSIFVINLLTGLFKRK